MVEQVLKQVISILPVSKDRVEMPTYKVYSKSHEITKYSELSEFTWIESREDEVFVEFADKKQVKIFYRSLRDLKLICYVNFL